MERHVTSDASRHLVLIERSGLLVVAGLDPVEIPDHRSLREQHLARFRVSARPTDE